jgi:hypothetical protein
LLIYRQGNAEKGIAIGLKRATADNSVCAYNQLTVCITGAGAGVNNVREQKKHEARKMFGNAA